MGRVLRGIITLAISLILTIACAYIRTDRDSRINEEASHSIRQHYEELTRSDSASANRMYTSLLVEGKYDINNSDPSSLNYTIANIVRRYGLVIVYAPKMDKEFTAYLKENLFLFIVFLLLTSACTTLLSVSFRLRADATQFKDEAKKFEDETKKLVAAIRTLSVDCPIQEISIKRQITVTLAEVLTGDPVLAEKLMSPNASFADSQVLESIGRFCEKNAHVGLVMLRSNCSYRDYADFAILLDKGAKVSISSTNVGPFKDLFTNKKEAVLGHLDAVNKMATKAAGASGIVVKRRQIHMSNAEKGAFDKSLRSGAPEAQDFKTYYMIPPGVDFKEFTVDLTLSWAEFMGDYIVYDNRVILKYDKDTRVLMLIVGQEVINQHIAVFNK